MEAHEQTPDPTETTPEEDPFADVPADPLVGAEEQPLPPGVEEGSLTGDNPSEEPPPEEVLQDPEAEVEEYEPEAPAEEGEPLPPAEEQPADEEPVEQEEPEVPAADVPEDVPPEPQPEAESEPDEPEEVPTPEPETPVEGKEGSDDTPSESPPKKPKRSRKGRSRAKKGAKSAKEDREYVVLVESDKPGEWHEAFARNAKAEGLHTGSDTEPTTIKARNGEVALRRAFRLLAEDEAGNYTLVATPKPYFRPKAVNGRVMKQTAITIG